MNKLLEAAQKMADCYPAWMTTHPATEDADDLRTQLARYRCTCGKFPVEGHVHCWWMVRCCGHEWESWDEFLAWREEQDAKAGA